MQAFLANFQFLRPWWLLLLLPLVVLLYYIYKHRQSGMAWRRVCDAELLPYILTAGVTRVNRWPFVLMGLAALCLVTALAGPVWQKAPQPVFRTDSALIIVLDLSRSMNAQDIRPTRLQRAKLKITDILRRRTEGQTALIVFSLESFTVSPLTQDTNTIELLIPSLNADIMPSQGSQAYLAIDQARELFTQSGVMHGQVLLITDSAGNARLDSSVRKLAAKGHRLSVLGVGTPQGAPIPLRDGGFLKDKTGSIVVPKLDASALARLAQSGGGRYHTLANTDADVDYILSAIDRQHKLEQKQQKMPFETDIWIEQGPWLVALMLPIAALYFRRGWLMAVVLLVAPLPRPSYAFDWQYLWSTPDQVGQKYYDRDDPKEAAKHFTRPDWSAASNYKSGNYQKSLQTWEGADSSDGLYNKGNALVKLGKFPEALQAYNEAIKLDKNNKDARYNRDLIKEFMKKQQQDQQQNQQGDSGKQDEQQADKQQGESGDQSDQQSGEQQQQAQGQQQSEQQAAQNSGSKDQQDEQAGQQSAGQSEQKPEGDEQQENQLAQKQPKEKDASDESQQAQAAQTGKTDQQSQMEKNEQDERRLAVEQWLRRVPDDPGGLLRRKFQYQARVRGGQVKGTNPW